MFSEKNNKKNFIFSRSIDQTSIKKFIDEVDLKTLAIKYFDANEGECSVYKVNNEIDEAKVLSAHLTTFKRNHIKRTFSARISKKIIDNVELEIFKSDGCTGITFADDRHHDIKGNEENFFLLLAKMKEAVLSGEEIYRPIEPPTIANLINDFLSFNESEITQWARANCQKALSHKDFKHLLNQS